MTSVSDMVSEHTHITYITTCNQRAAFETERSDSEVCVCEERGGCVQVQESEYRMEAGGWTTAFN